MARISVPAQPARGAGQVVGDESVDQLDDAGPVVAAGHQVGGLLYGRQGVGHGHTALAEGEKSVVVLGVADADDIVRRKAQLG